MKKRATKKPSPTRAPGFYLCRGKFEAGGRSGLKFNYMKITSGTWVGSGAEGTVVVQLANGDELQIVMEADGLSIAVRALFVEMVVCPDVSNVVHLSTDRAFVRSRTPHKDRP